MGSSKILGTKLSKNRVKKGSKIPQPILPELPMVTRNLDCNLTPYTPPVTIYHQESTFRSSRTVNDSITKVLSVNRGLTYQGVAVGKKASDGKRMLSFQEVDMGPIKVLDDCDRMSGNHDDLDFELTEGRL